MRIAWNKGIRGEAYKGHFKNGFKGIFQKGHKTWIKGKFHSEKTKKRFSIVFKGRTAWNKGLNFSGMSGKQHSEETRKKMSQSHKGHPPTSGHTGKKHSEATKQRIRESLLNGRQPKENRKHSYDSRYKVWMKAVKNRDGWKCKISNGDCSGRLEAHHILGWSSHPELRYQINNGITLCCFHHPRKRVEEERLSPYFQELLVSKVK